MGLAALRSGVPADLSDSRSSDARPASRTLHVSPKAGDLGMALFLASLTMLFLASLVGFVVIRLIRRTPVTDPRTGAVIQDAWPPLGAVHLPWVFWVSTGLILVSSFTAQRALYSVRLERQRAFRHMLTATLGLAIAFLLIQAPALASLLHEHLAQLGGDRGHPLFALVFVLVLVHAVHLLGGVIPLLVVTSRAHAGRYDHEHHGPVKHIVRYWHFLDVVWLVMFAVLLFAG